MNCRVAIIGGTGFETALQERFGQPALRQTVDTKYGVVDVTFFLTDSGPLGYLPRHGDAHHIAPHRINHRANIAALHAVGASSVLSTSAVGSLKKEFAPGDFVLIDDFIDMRGGSPTTFFESDTVTHTDFSEPISVRLREHLLDSSRIGAVDPIIHARGVYLCVSGPRYETPAEVRVFALLGGDVVGMTVAPEAVLAREIGIAYASVSVVTNLGTGLSAVGLSHAEVEQIMSSRRPFLVDLLLGAANRALSECAE